MKGSRREQERERDGERESARFGRKELDRLEVQCGMLMFQTP